MIGRRKLTVAPSPVSCAEPAEMPAALERYLDTLLLTQSGTAELMLRLCPETSAALRDALRAARRAPALNDQTRAHLAATGVLRERIDRDLRRHSWAWVICALLAFWWGVLA